MKTALLVLILAAVPVAAFAQEEKQPPADSSRVSIQGCAKGRNFVTTEPPETEPSRVYVPAGRRFRLNGPKTMLADIKKQEGMMIEVTGLVKKSDLREPNGLPIRGGRVTIGGGTPQAPLGGGGMSNSPMFSEAVLDLESWRPLPESCPKR